MRKYQQLSCTYLCRALVALLDPKPTQMLQRKTGKSTTYMTFSCFLHFLFISKHQCSIKVWMTSFFWHIAKTNTGLQLHPNCKSAKWKQQVVALILTLSTQWCIQVEKGLKGLKDLFHSKIKHKAPGACTKLSRRLKTNLRYETSPQSRTVVGNVNFCDPGYQTDQDSFWEVIKVMLF